MTLLLAQKAVLNKTHTILLSIFTVLPILSILTSNLANSLNVNTTGLLKITDNLHDDREYSILMPENVEWQF